MEIESASTFLANLLRFESRHVKIARVEMFRRTLEELLRHHYQHHWFPEKPCKGSGYRCLRINHKMDPLIAKAGDVCGFNESDLRKLLPKELTMWIDPQEVSYRIGENGSICVLYDGAKSQFSADASTRTSGVQQLTVQWTNQSEYYNRPIPSVLASSVHSSSKFGSVHSSSKFGPIPYQSCKESERSYWNNYVPETRFLRINDFVSS